MISNQTEITVLSTAIQKVECLDELIQHQDIFTDPTCKIVFSICRELYDENIRIDLGILYSRLQEKKADVNASTMAEIVKEMPSINFTYLIETLIERNRRERVKAIAIDIHACAKKNIDYNGFVDELIKEIEGKENKNKTYCSIQDLARMNLDDIFERARYQKTGYDSLDDIIAGIFCGQLFIIAGRPGTGKTTFALNLIYNMQIPILLFSLEMKRHEIYAKFLSMESKVESWRIEAKRTTEIEMQRILSAHEKYKSYLHIKLFDSDITFQRIKTVIKQQANQVKAIVIDYLQLIPGLKGENQNLRLATMTRDFKLLAHDLNIPVVLLSQLSRDSAKEKRVPVLSDLRDSGAIEQDADVVLFLHENKEGKTEIIIAKNRKGRIGKTVDIEFEKQFSYFYDYQTIKRNEKEEKSNLIGG